MIPIVSDSYLFIGFIALGGALLAIAGILLLSRIKQIPKFPPVDKTRNNLRVKHDANDER